MKKINRNSPCPCGSGKKYKHCCMNIKEKDNYLKQNDYTFFQTSELDAPKLKAYMESHDCIQILDYLIAIQMNPANHGKNLRIEHIIQLAISCLGKNHNTPDFIHFKKLIDEEYPLDYMEDIPMNMFAETVIFHGGNYTFFPGISAYAAELFQAMTEAIFHNESIFPKKFQKDIYQGILIILILGDIIANRAGISGLTRGNENPKEKISNPSTNHSYAINERMMDSILIQNGLDKQILNEFILNTNNPKLLTEIAEENPILYKPIIHYNGYYYFIGITNQGCAINNYILKTAIKNKYLPLLVQETQRSIWMRIGFYCEKYMDWQTLNFDKQIYNNNHCYESIFQIDVNWIAYVCYVKNKPSNVPIDGNNNYESLNITAQLEKTISAIRQDEKTKNHHILTLVLYSSMGENFSLFIDKQLNTDHLLMFPAFDFLQLVQTEEWDSMSLVRFARTKEKEAFLDNPLNQILDIYSLYKQYKENFYTSDKEKPTLLYIEANSGYKLIFESKEKLNRHCTPLTVDNQTLCIPVKRDYDFPNIYTPIDIPITAKCCESYTQPIWIKCSQIEKDGINPSSIINTIITAIAFWMDKLKPSLIEFINTQYKRPIEIELFFSKDILSDKELHNEINPPSSTGNLNIIKTASGISVFFDRDYILAFMGPYNENERDMMVKIIKGLFNTDNNTAQTIVNKTIPDNHSKMILIIETSIGSLSFPLWLNKPIYIHKSTEQILLDKFPQWMKENKYIITKLNTKDEKIKFLHFGVDVLLNKLKEKVSKFDSKLLLKLLINNYESLIFKRNSNKIDQPAQLFCFGDTSKKRQEFFDNETLLSNTELATRVLIEYVSATQYQIGTQHPGHDDIEYLLAITKQIIDIGGICDAIFFDVANHSIEMLPSGRYSMHDNDFKVNIDSFSNLHYNENVNVLIENFTDTMEQLSINKIQLPDANNEELTKIDNAFKIEWGITYSNILQFLHTCFYITTNKQTSVIEICEEELINEMLLINNNLTPDIITTCLNRLSLNKRGEYLKPPKGMTEKEISPWVYNRELSYLRRPIIHYILPNEQSIYILGARSCILSGLQLTDLVYSGKLRNVGANLQRLLGIFEDKKGREFNEDVRLFLKQIPELNVWDYEVSIKSKGHLKTNDNKDYGDIDILAYNATTNTLYSIECKNTSMAKNVREMKNEMDSYLGRGENPESDKKKALVLKHLRRHQWLKNNIKQVQDFISARQEPTIKSMIITATAIPTSYLKNVESPLSILNYSQLKQKGLSYLNECKEANINILC